VVELVRCSVPANATAEAGETGSALNAFLSAAWYLRCAFLPLAHPYVIETSQQETYLHEYVV
jgi:hypothetical protein